jgi:hypothetical protein
MLIKKSPIVKDPLIFLESIVWTFIILSPFSVHIFVFDGFKAYGREFYPLRLTAKPSETVFYGTR